MIGTESLSVTVFPTAEHQGVDEVAETTVDCGQAQIAAFNAAAGAGTLRYEEGVAGDAAAQYDTMIVGLYEIRGKLDSAANVASFGGFASAKELQSGFANKATERVAVIEQLIEGAMRLKEAYLRAGNLIQDADAQNAVTLRFASDSESLKGEGP